MPGTTPCNDRPQVRALVWAWNAQMGWMFANGGPRTTEGSLMCKRGVNLEFVRQDDAEQMKAELLKFATEHRRGQAQPKGGAHFVAIMGDGSAQFLAALNPELARLGAGYQAHVIGSAGYSRGEDKFMGPPAWRSHAQAARGAYIAGYLKDGDWNIALKWAGDNGICNNPDDKVYDPQCLNWAASKDYIDAAQKYVQGYCNELPLKNKHGEKRRVCVDSVVTWTPGDVIVAQKRGGVVSIVSTREYASQMPNAIIGIEPWMSRNRPVVEGMLGGLLEGGRLVKASPQALRRAAEISDSVYQEKGTGPEYWLRYFHGVSETDKQGLTVQLGGSKVNDCGDNVALFGLQPGYANAFEATYTTFGRIVHEQYPEDVPSFPAANEVIDTSYLQAVLATSNAKLVPATETASYALVSASPDKVELGRRTWKLNFDTGKDSFRSDAKPVLTELMQGLIVAGSTAVEIHGHTDKRRHRAHQPDAQRKTRLRGQELAQERRRAELPGPPLPGLRARFGPAGRVERHGTRTRGQPPRRDRPLVQVTRKARPCSTYSRRIERSPAVLCACSGCCWVAEFPGPVVAHVVRRAADPGPGALGLRTALSRQALMPHLLSSLEANLTALFIATAAVARLGLRERTAGGPPAGGAGLENPVLGLRRRHRGVHLLFPTGHDLKIALLVFGITGFFVTAMCDEVLAIRERAFRPRARLGMSAWRVTWEVVVLGTLDRAFDVFRQNAAMGWMLLTAVETLVRSEGGVGVMLATQNKHMDLAGVAALQVVIFGVGIAQDYAIGVFKNLVCPHAALRVAGR
jgi:outer membrane protein OmpA-like peptidoglycan-associated protein